VLHFDERVINTMCQKKTSKLGEKYQGSYSMSLREKIQTSSKHEKFILEYMRDKNRNRRIFRLTCEDRDENFLGNFNITASNLVNAFKDLDRDIKNTLQEMSSKFLKYGVDVTNADKFRVVMVGGFSNFYLSKRSVKEFFGADDEDRRFETHFRADDIALAISKGASLIAEDIINIDETYPISVGLIVKIMNSKGFVEEHYISIFKQGDSVQTYEVSYIDKRISQAGKLIFAFDNEDKKSSFKIKIDKDVHELYPNFNRINNKWQIGFSIDSSNFIYVHVRDKYGYEKKTELGDILNEYSEAVIMVE